MRVLHPGGRDHPAVQSAGDLHGGDGGDAYEAWRKMKADGKKQQTVTKIKSLQNENVFLDQLV